LGAGDPCAACRRGFELLEQAFRDRSHSMAFMKVDPRFADLRDDRRYRDLLGRVGLDGPPAAARVSG
jgi:hypothetical protein